jgi:hypothetical protein
LDVFKIRELYKDGSCARWILDGLAERKRKPKETTVDSLEEISQSKWSRKQLLDVMKDLTELGCGDLRLGRKSLKTRIEWKVDAISLAKAARGEGDQISPFTPGDALVKVVSSHLNEPPASPLEASTPVVPDHVRHRYHLRDGCEIQFDLPRDLNGREAIRLADFIKTLPID